jgi:hypothetical protein
VNEEGREAPDRRLRSDEDPKPGTASKWVDEEFAGEHGTTLSEASRTEDKQSDDSAKDPGGAKRKAEAESGDEGIIKKVTHAAHEVDRQLSGEYERREDSTAP